MKGKTDRWVVIGCNSFSGAHCVNDLLQAGNEVAGISRSPKPHGAFLPYTWSAERGDFIFLQSDLNTQLPDISNFLREWCPDYVINFAAQGMVAQSWQFPHHWYQTNIVSMVQLHEILKDQNQLRRYVHISTPEVYGHCEGAVKEEQRFNPSTPYAVSRAACDFSLMAYHRTYNFPVVFTRAANVFGPGQQLYRIIPRTILAVRTGRKLQLHGGGYSERSFIHITDVIRATVDLAIRGTSGKAYHLATPTQVTIRRLVQMICEIMGADFGDIVNETGDRMGKDQSYSLDCSRIESELGWKPKQSLEGGLKEVIEWVDLHLEDLVKEPFDYKHKP